MKFYPSPLCKCSLLILSVFLWKEGIGCDTEKASVFFARTIHSKLAFLGDICLAKNQEYDLGSVLGKFSIEKPRPESIPVMIFLLPRPASKHDSAKLEVEFVKMGRFSQISLFTTFRKDSILVAPRDDINEIWPSALIKTDGILLKWVEWSRGFKAYMLPCTVWFDGVTYGPFEKAGKVELSVLFKRNGKKKSQHGKEVFVKALDARKSVLVDFETEGIDGQIVEEGRHGILIDYNGSFKNFREFN